jgi:hypothetical protein
LPPPLRFRARTSWRISGSKHNGTRVGTAPRSRDAPGPEFAKDTLKKMEGAGNAGCFSPHPRPRVQREGVHELLVTTGQAKSPAFPARWLYDLLRALSGDRAFLSPSLTIMLKHCRQLRASVEALRPRGFVVRVWRLRLVHHTRPSHPAPNTRDDRPSAPPGEARDGESIKVFLAPREAKYFSQNDWTFSANHPAGRTALTGYLPVSRTRCSVQRCGADPGPTVTNGDKRTPDQQRTTPQTRRAAQHPGNDESSFRGASETSEPGMTRTLRYFFTSGHSLCESGFAASSAEMVATSL